MEWEAPAILLAVRPFGEGDALATVMTAAGGACRGLVRGGAGRSRVATFQPGNVLQARWTARLADQLGTLSGELVHPAAALAMEDALALAILSSACAVAEGALPEREPHPAAFEGLLRLLTRLGRPLDALGELVAWELTLLRELGYGLDLQRCALTGDTAGLAFVSPRTGRAVSAAAAGVWQDRLLPLPAVLRGEAPSLAGWQAALSLTEHFLARDAFASHNRPLPPARERLAHRLATLVGPHSPRGDAGLDKG